MKVIGLGSPDDLRVRFDATEVDVLVDVLRDLRAKATRDAAETYANTPPRETRPIDDRHDRLRGLEGLLMRLEHARALKAARRTVVEPRDVTAAAFGEHVDIRWIAYRWGNS